jgi:PPOX class probable F420-dependent enzyme
MTREEVNRFLSLPHIAKLATTNLDGSPQISPVWFYREGNAIFISTYKEAVKVRNIRYNPTVSLLIDSSNGGLKLKGILMRGSATLIEGDECNKIVKQIYDKYIPTRITRKDKAATAYKKAVTSHSDSYICIKVAPSTISTWNYGKITVNDATALAESLQPYDTDKAIRVLG